MSSQFSSSSHSSSTGPHYDEFQTVAWCGYGDHEIPNDIAQGFAEAATPHNGGAGPSRWGGHLVSKITRFSLFALIVILINSSFCPGLLLRTRSLGSPAGHPYRRDLPLLQKEGIPQPPPHPEGGAPGGGRPLGVVAKV